MTEKQSKILKVTERKIKTMINYYGYNPETHAKAEKMLQQVEVPVRDGDRFKLIKPFSHLSLFEILDLTGEEIDFLLSDSEMED